MSNVTVSIIIPIFNAQIYLNDCIDSIINQTFSDFELILIDDGSTDDSGLICDNFALKDNRIKVIHKNNEGVSAARNEGIKISIGKFICFVDADDTIDSIFLEKLITANFKNYDLVICGYKVIRNEKKKKLIEYNYCHSFTGSIKDFLYNIPIYIDNCLIQTVWGKLFKSEIIKSNNLTFMADINLAEDVLFSYSYLEKTSSIISIKECLYNYNKYEQNTLSTTYREYRLDLYLYLYKILSDLLKIHEIELMAENKYYIERSICFAVISSIKDLYISKPKFKKIIRLEKIKKMISNPLVKKAFNICKKHQRQINLLNYFIVTENLVVLDLYFLTKEFSRKNFKWAFNTVKKINR